MAPDLEAQVLKAAQCSRCNGTGKAPPGSSAYKCPTCLGEGCFITAADVARALEKVTAHVRETLRLEDWYAEDIETEIVELERIALAALREGP